MALADKAQQLDQQIAAAVKTALGNLRQELEDRLRQSTESLRERIDGIEDVLPSRFLAAEDLAALTREETARAGREALSRLAAGLVALDQGTTQAAVLATLMEQGLAYASRTALFLTPPEAARGWRGLGFGDAGLALAQTSIPYGTSPGWSELAEGRGWVSLSPAECADLASRLECPMAREAVLIPLVLADHIAAALYADTTEAAQALELSALQSLVHAAGGAIESLPLRTRHRHPTFDPAADAAGEGLPLWAASALPEAPPEPSSEALPEALAEVPTVAPALFAEVVAPALQALPVSEPSQTFPSSETAKIPTEIAEHEPWDETAAEFFSPAPALASEPVLPPPPEPEAPEGLPVSGSVSTEAMPAVAEDASSLPWPEPPVATEVDEYELPPISDWTEPARVDPVASTLAMPEIDLSDDATILIPRRTVPAATPPPPPAEEPEEEATHPGRSSYAATRALPRPTGGSAEVRPPSGIEGPGLAFSRGQRTAAEPAGHEEARRLARLLVSEIRLYNEDQVEEGRRGRDIYARLRDEIDRSRKMFDERISADVRAARDYFTEELVRRLADGDPDALGI